MHKALSIQPTNAEALFEQGRIYQLQKRYDEAITVYERITEDSRFYPQALEALVNLYYLKEEYDKLISGASKYTTLDDKNVGVHYMLGR